MPQPRRILFAIYGVLISLALGSGCRQSGQNNKAGAVNPVSSYMPAVWTDSDREGNIRKALPLAETIIRKSADSLHLPGLAWGIVLDGKLIYTGYSGFTNMERKTPVDGLSAFRIASMSKSFTAMAIMMLRDQGKLHLDDPAESYIQEMKAMPYPSSDAPRITIRDLMTHKAGFPEDNPYGDRQLAQPDDSLMEFLKAGPSFSTVPGTNYEYSNLGFAMLGHIVSKVSGKTYQEFIRENIFRPLGMTHTWWDYTQVPPEQLAHGYRWINNSWREEELLKDGAWGAMGGLITTVEDFSRYMLFHLSAWPPRNGDEEGILKRSSLREMQQPWNFNNLNAVYTYGSGRQCATVSSYGFGLGIVRDCENRNFIGHGGGLPGFGSNWRIMPEYGLGIVILSNRTYAPMSALTLHLLDTLLAVSHLQRYQLPPSEILEKRKKELIALLPGWEKAGSSNIFAVNFFPDYPIDSLRKQSLEILARSGKINSVSPVRSQNQLRGYFDMEGEMSIVRISFTLSPEHDPKIQEFHMTELPLKKPDQ